MQQREPKRDYVFTLNDICRQHIPVVVIRTDYFNEVTHVTNLDSTPLTVTSHNLVRLHPLLIYEIHMVMTDIQ
jgi:hypothetical protein